MQSIFGISTTFTTSEVYALYVQRYPGDLQMMEDRKVDKPRAHDLEAYLNGEIYVYSQQMDGSDPDRPAIEPRGVKTYRFASNLINDYSLSKEDAIIPHLSPGDYLPTKEDFESAYRMLCSPGQKIDKGAILDQIEKNAINSGRNLKINWRLITERNIEIWVNEAETIDRPIDE